MDYSSKAAYLKGLIEGMNLDNSKEETKIFNVMADLVYDMSLEIENLKSSCDENKELIYELDEDLGDVEKVVCGCKGKHKHSSCGHSCDVDGDYMESDEYVDEDKLEDGDDGESEEKYEVLCPHCSQVINLENANLKGDDIVCPKCGKELELDFEEDGEALDKSY